MLRFLLIFGLFITYTGAGQTFTKAYTDSALSLFEFQRISPLANGGWYAAAAIRQGAESSSGVTKFDETGAVIWSVTPENRRDPRALVALNDGSVLFFNNNFGFQGYFDASVVHVGANGNFISERIWGETDDQDDWYDAVKLDNGEVISIGMSRESSSFSHRILLAKFSTTGQLLWEKTFDGGSIFNFSELIALSSGAFYAIGRSFSNGITTSLLAKFSADGNLLWVKSYDYGTENSFFITGMPLIDGSLLLASYQTAQFTGDPSLVLLKISDNGDVISQKSYKNNYNLAPIKMGQFSPDTLLLAVVSNSVVFPAVDNDLYVLQVSPEGDLLGQLGFGTAAQEFGYDAFFTDDQIVICGMMDTSADGSARRGLISKSGFFTSCCEKPVELNSIAPPAVPTVNTLLFTSSAIPVKQNNIVVLNPLPLSSAVFCEGLDGIDVINPDTSLCLGDTIRIGLNSNINGNILWNTGDTGPEILVSTPGIYNVSVSGACGEVNDTIIVQNIGNRVEIETIPDQDACPDERITLSASGGSLYQWYDPAGTLLFNIANPSFIPDQSIEYKVVVSDGQCRDSAKVKINVWDAPQVSAGLDVSIRVGTTVQLSASGASTYLWLPSTGLSCKDCPEPVASPSGTSTYTVIGTDENGCTNTATVTVLVTQPCPFFIPNVLMPEGAALSENGMFEVQGKEISTDGFILRIYSRWGELVFESKNPQDQWDGTYQNQAAPAGVYVFQLEMSNCDGRVKTSGNITLVR